MLVKAKNRRWYIYTLQIENDVPFFVCHGEDHSLDELLYLLVQSSDV